MTSVPGKRASVARCVVAGLSVLAAASCTSNDGLRVMGPAENGSTAPAPPASGKATSVSVDPVRVLRDDEQVSGRVKAALTPCEGDGSYPVDASYGRVRKVPVVLVNVYPCGAIGHEGVGNPGNGAPVASYLGSFAYTVHDGTVSDVLALPPGRRLVFGVPGDGVVMALVPVYHSGDRPCCASDGKVARYRWNGSRFEAESTN